jgi:ferredoxin
VSSKADYTPEEWSALVRAPLLVRTAQAAADAAKEGGFLGFGAVKVSDGEHRMLDQVAAALEGVAADPAAAGAGASNETAAGPALDTAAGGSEEERDEAPAGVPRVDLELCTGCGICVDVCPEIFEIGDDGSSQVIDDYGCEDAGCCEEAVEQCPEGAISIGPLQHI